MKTWVVKADGRHWMGNADDALEAVRYAIAKAGLLADKWIVIDWDANVYVVEERTADG